MLDGDRITPEHTEHPAWKVIDSALVLSAPPWLSVYRPEVSF